VDNIYGVRVDGLRLRWTHRHPGWHQVHLIEHVDKVFVGLFLPQVLDDGLASRPEGISCIEDVDDDIGRVQYLVQLSPDTAGGALGVYSLSGSGRSGMVDRTEVGGFICIVSGAGGRKLDIPCSPFPASTVAELSPSSSMLPTAKRGRFRWAFGPKVSEKGSVCTMWGRCGVSDIR
jgi:hypothetical protein